MSNSHRTWLTLGLLAILLLAGACGATQGGAVAQGDAARGRSLWTQSACVGCHGVDAEGNRAGPALADTPLSLRDVTNIVRRGGPGMPKYPAGQIGDQDLEDMYAWFQNPVPVAAGEMGQELWAQSACASCHGASALGGRGPSLAGISQPFAAFQSVVRQGAEGMPPFSRTQMSDETLQALYNWLEGQAQVPAAPEALWSEAGCGGCHGAKAEGASARGLAGGEFSYDEFESVVREGEAGMPSYSTSQLSDESLQALYDWLEGQVQVPVAPEVLWVEAGCGGCHGAQAEGASARGLAGGDLAYEEFERLVREGDAGMPSYSTSQLSDTELQRMYDWLMTLP